MKNRFRNNTAENNSLVAVFRAIFSQAFHTKPAYTMIRPDEKLADFVIDEGLMSELHGWIERLRASHSIDSPITHAVLITGDAGTGKSLLACAVAGEAGVPLFSLALGAITAQDLSRLAQQARAAAPAVVLVEALDENGQPEPHHDHGSQCAAQLAAELERLAADPQILLLGTARCARQVDPVLLQAGRFERQITLDLPDRQARQQILAIQTRSLKLAKDVNLGMIARVTTGFSGGDLAGLCRQATQCSALRGDVQTNMADFEQAVDQTLLAIAGRSLVNEQTRRILAYHEAGHALAAWINPAVEPIPRASLLHRWQMDFSPQDVPGYDHVGLSKDYLLASLSVLLAGRAGEEIGIGEITTGAENDLVVATELAHRMVSRWGMGRLGPVSFDQLAAREPRSAGESAAYSETTAARIDQDVQELLKSQYQAVCQQLKDSRQALDRLAEALLDDETVGQKEIARILGPRPFHLGEDHDLSVDMSEVQQPSKIN